MSQDFSRGTEHIDVAYTARLARLRLSDGERDEFQKQLDAVLAYVEQLRELDVEGVEPTAQAVPLSNVFREDEPGDSLPLDLSMANAPESRDGHFLVPRIVE